MFNDDRIRVTHVGNLARPPELQEYLRAYENGDALDEAAFDECLRRSVADVVRKQHETGIDIPSDGEFGKAISWSQYALERLSGFERRPAPAGRQSFFASAPIARASPSSTPTFDRAEGPPATAVTGSLAVCVGPIEYTGQEELQRDIARLQGGPRGRGREEASCRSRRRRA